MKQHAVWNIKWINVTWSLYLTGVVFTFYHKAYEKHITLTEKDTITNQMAFCEK